MRMRLWVARLFCEYSRILGVGGAPRGEPLLEGRDLDVDDGCTGKDQDFVGRRQAPSTS